MIMNAVAHTPIFDRFDIRFSRVQVLAVAGVLLITSLGVFLFQIASSHDPFLPNGVPLGGDFIAFWSAARGVVAGHAGDLYNSAFFESWLQTMVPAENPYDLTWQYPPSYYFLILPLAFLPYSAGYAAWTGGSLIAFAATGYVIGLRERWLFVVLSAPVVFNAAITGQNGFLTASLLAGAALLPDRRPMIAGLCAALLTVKPQLGLLLPIAYAAGGCWRAFGWATVGTVFLGLASVIAFGVEPWLHFPEGAVLVSERLSDGVMPLFKMPTTFAGFMLAGAPKALALSVHSVIAFCVVGTVAIVWRRVREPDLRAAILCTGVFFISPYIYYYELVVAALPIALVAKRAMKSGWLKYEQLSFGMLFLIPMFIPSAAYRFGLHIGFGVSVIAFLIVMRRIRSTHPDFRLLRRQKSALLA